jgi:hypothetical protein
VMLGKVTRVDVATLGVMLKVMDRKVGRRLIYGIRKDGGDSVGYDNELSHVINDILIKH